MMTTGTLVGFYFFQYFKTVYFGQFEIQQHYHWRIIEVSCRITSLAE
jgi:hypothetical protein